MLSNTNMTSFVFKSITITNVLLSLQVFMLLIQGSDSMTLLSDEELNFLFPTPEPEFEYPFKGWSYYIRATNLHREQARAEVGWGQWSKPNYPNNFNDVCGLNPMGFTCENGVENNELANCGGDYQTREDCTFWVCGEDDKGGIRGSIEGGMGYWPGYTIEKSQVTWQIPGATSANYEIFGGTMLGDRAQPCINLGAAVRVSNQLLVPNDFISFEGGPNVDGFLGYMLQATPIGKRADTDTANYYTIIADAANFKGPVLYISTWFWDSRINWHPQSKNFAHPDASLGYVARGFEGRVGSMVSNSKDSNGKKYAYSTQWGMPLDKDNIHSTLYTGHAQYSDGWIDSLLNDVMDGVTDVSTNPPDISGAASGARTVVSCNSVNNIEEKGVRLEYEGENVESFVISDFGVTAVDAAGNDNTNLGCPVKYKLDKSKMDCETEENICLASKYFTFNGELKLPSEVPDNVKQLLESDKRFPTHRVDNRSNHGPPKGPERECFEDPGPSSPMYCVRTGTESWIGFKWYRFVDQPELTNVFKSLPEDERNAAKSYMQARIENLHKLGKDTPWFEPPGGDE
mmetsp:Transcript_12794/g.15661  ORF Transcript_12794/g.15661 Transcript_12794/m.15661 type:complete len:572 (+) Transcript_12794:169-1884(+)